MYASSKGKKRRGGDHSGRTAIVTMRSPSPEKIKEECELFKKIKET